MAGEEVTGVSSMPMKGSPLHHTNNTHTGAEKAAGQQRGTLEQRQKLEVPKRMQEQQHGHKRRWPTQGAPPADSAGSFDWLVLALLPGCPP